MPDSPSSLHPDAALRLRLHQFRCHAELELQLPPGRNFFFGANGNGKTTVLEALYYISRLRSFRTALPRELAAHGAHLFRVEAETHLHDAADVDGIGDTESLCSTWEHGSRSLLLNGQTPKLAEFWGRLPTVLFEDGDREIVTGPGAGRRAWVDGLIAQRDPSYVTLAQRYARALKQRNAWLKSHHHHGLGGASAEVGASLTQHLTDLGIAVTEKRAALSAELNMLWPTALAQMNVPAALASVAVSGRGNASSDSPEFCGIVYEPSFELKPAEDVAGAQLSGLKAAAPDWDSAAAS
ncbi:MAG TPA: AAA family ATPase, partial [Candidatus Methylacidiphilales bacterium]|nr:AAA family ATPase [Candidatus Methylacidiphilales bacterium]